MLVLVFWDVKFINLVVILAAQNQVPKQAIDLPVVAVQVEAADHLAAEVETVVVEVELAAAVVLAEVEEVVTQSLLTQILICSQKIKFYISFSFSKGLQHQYLKFLQPPYSQLFYSKLF